MMEMFVFGGLVFLGWAVMCAAWDIAAAIRHAGERMRMPDEHAVNVHFVEPECPGCDDWDCDCDEDEDYEDDDE